MIKQYTLCRTRERRSVTVAPEKEITVIAKKGSKDPYKIGTEVDKSLAEDGHLVAPIKKNVKVGSITLESTDKYGFRR